ncbi:MAG: TlpA disulfide reductase family protein [Bacteroidota bacterium]
MHKIALSILAVIGFTGFSSEKAPSLLGEKVPLFTAISLSGDTVSMEKLKGNLVLLDFWASWNQPSRKNNLTTLKLYEKYRAVSLRKRRKFIVIQISLDTRADLWRTAIHRDNLYWKTHICDLKGWNSPYVSQFQFKRIPTNLLIDTAGNIIARDIWESRLDSALSVWMQ